MATKTTAKKTVGKTATGKTTTRTASNSRNKTSRSITTAKTGNKKSTAKKTPTGTTTRASTKSTAGTRNTTTGNRASSKRTTAKKTTGAKTTNRTATRSSYTTTGAAASPTATVKGASKGSTVKFPQSGYKTTTGKANPLGAWVNKTGVNFSLYSPYATSVELLLFASATADKPTQTIKLNSTNRTFYFWHVFVEGLKSGAYYAYRVDGPREMNFNRNKVLADPYAFAYTSAVWNRQKACGTADNVSTSMRSIVVDMTTFDWGSDKPINRPLNETVIYEMHVAGFTRSSTSGTTRPGTYSATIEKIPYLKKLGITAVQLMPTCEFDETEIKGYNPKTKKAQTNYWGYGSFGYFAPEGSYAINPTNGTQVNEFREMVKAFHKAGIEVYLDIAFDFTSEGNHEGPTINFKGLANNDYYQLSGPNGQYYADYTGNGNAFNTNHPAVQRFVLDCLEFWVNQMHVDGFRFGTGAAFTRNNDGSTNNYSTLLWNINYSQWLTSTKFFAENWNGAYLYQNSAPQSNRWSEWNARYRDDIRRFVKGDPGIVGAVAARISGSADIYNFSGSGPTNTVNYLASHDGFTLWDTVSYNTKHNEPNGFGNADGANTNWSWNGGAEGLTNEKGIWALRRRQIKNFATILFLSQGVPMFAAGDEVGRTQWGNNNAFNQNNESTWFDWNLVKQNADLYRFFQNLISFRKSHPAFQRNTFFNNYVNDRMLADISWHGTKLSNPGWHDADARALAFTLGGSRKNADVHVMMNMCWDDLEFEIPAVSGRSWYVAVDTSLASPRDIAEFGKETKFAGKTFTVPGRSVVVLISK